MKILMQQGAYFPWIGGAEIFMQRLAEHLASKGNQVDVVTGLWSKPDIYTENWDKEFEVINGVNVHRVKTLNLRYADVISCMLRMVAKTIELDKVHHYEVIHSHIFPAMVCGAMAKREKKLLVTLQGGDIGDYKESNVVIRTLELPFIFWSLRKADIIHAVSTHIAGAARKLGAREVVVVPNGVDTQLFRPQDKLRLRRKLGYKPNEKIIVSSSRLTPKNGLDYLIKAVAKIPELKLIIIGDGEQRQSLQSLINRLRLKNRAFLLGYLAHDKLPEYLNIADAFCRPSINEGFGISFIEAMACKIPTIGTSVGGITDIIVDGKNGLLVPPENVGELAGAIKKVLNDKNFSDHIAEEGYKAVMEKFTWEAVLGQMERVYERLLGQHRRQGE
ncbi:MAG TPA: glycosyltransferase family 4 protein [Dehalococcoidia bacterium]|jgi:glycosyltransferase involved in cell wall biosynthesis|nr:glycosyltransferase family 4 protein [Dehalococcoidia bacterium]